MAALTTKIGIVSAQKHCKSHLDGLRSDGFDVVCLGDKVNDIPETIGIVLVRVASSSHSAVSAARMWGKDTGLPVIYENGLSGMRRALSGLLQNPTKEAAPLPESTPPEVGERLSYLMDAAKLLLSHEQDLSLDALTEHLIKVFWEKYPKGPRSLAYLAGTAAKMVASPPALDSAPDTQEDVVSDTQGLPVQKTPFPGPSVSWARKITPTKLEAAYLYSQTVLGSLSVGDRAYYRKAYLKAEGTGNLPRKAERFFRSTFTRKPLHYVMFIYLLVGEGTPKSRAVLGSTYTQATRRQGSGYLGDAVAWYLGQDPPTALKESGPTKAQPTSSVSDVDSNTQAILELMEDLSSFKKSVRTEMSGIEEALTTGNRSLESALRASHPNVDSLVARIERLEVSGDLGANENEVRQTVHSAVQEAVEDMREDLRSDVANAFDALAAESGSSGGLSGNPFAAVEQVKAMLKAAGFKGTLTLTIE